MVGSSISDTPLTDDNTVSKSSCIITNPSESNIVQADTPIENSATADTPTSSVKSNTTSVTNCYTSESSDIQQNMPVGRCNAQCCNIENDGPYQLTDEEILKATRKTLGKKNEF